MIWLVGTQKHGGGDQLKNKKKKACSKNKINKMALGGTCAATGRHTSEMNTTSAKQACREVLTEADIKMPHGKRTCR